MGTMLVIDKNHYEHVGTSLQMMKFVDHCSTSHNAEKIRIHSNMDIRDFKNSDIRC